MRGYRHDDPVESVPACSRCAGLLRDLRLLLRPRRLDLSARSHDSHRASGRQELKGSPVMRASSCIHWATDGSGGHEDPRCARRPRRAVWATAPPRPTRLTPADRAWAVGRGGAGQRFTDACGQRQGGSPRCLCASVRARRGLPAGCWNSEDVTCGGTLINRSR